MQNPALGLDFVFETPYRASTLCFLFRNFLVKVN